MPDDPTPPAARARPVRSPAPRLPGTYAANYRDDPNWRRGVAVLWAFLALTAVGEAAHAAAILLSGQRYPAPADVARLCVGGALFVALWLGWGWLRWPLAAINFLYGAWLVVWTIFLHNDLVQKAALAGAPAPGYGIGSIPSFALGGACIAYAGYLAFSADVLDFLRHRREEGRGWVAGPIALGVMACVAALLGSQFFYSRWLGHERASAARFVTQSLETISAEHWAAAAYETRADPAYLATWYEGDRKDMFGRLSRLGTYRHSETPEAVIGSSLDETGGGFVLRGQVTMGQVDFEHGGTMFIIDVTRTLFGPWQMQGFDAGKPHFDIPAGARP